MSWDVTGREQRHDYFLVRMASVTKQSLQILTRRTDRKKKKGGTTENRYTRMSTEPFHL